MQPEFGDRPRCFQPDLRPATLCPEEFVVNPDNEEIMKRNAQLSKGGRQISSGGMASGGSYEESGSSHSSMAGHGSASGSASGSGGSYGSGGVVQVSPQHVNLKLRISKLKELHNYAVGLKYLFS